MITAVRSWAATLGGLALPLLVGVFATPRREIADSTLFPWAPVMADLEVYRMAAEVLVSGGDIMTAQAEGTGLMFIYPPIAAILFLPLALPVPDLVIQLGWITLCVVALYAMLHRLGLAGWRLSLVTAGVIWFCEPVHATLGFGQLGTILTALVVLDLVRGPSLVRGRQGTGAASEPEAGSARRRWTPEGLATGSASAVKVTSALFAVMLAFAGRLRAAVVVGGTIVGLTLIGLLILPGETARFAGTLLGGDTRTTEQMYYLMNQSMLGGLTRLLGDSPTTSILGLLLAAVTALAGAWIAALWYRRGNVLLAVSLCGVATLMASPISWTHHFVWVVPLGAALLDRDVPERLKLTGWLFVGWVSAAIFSVRLWYGGDIETTYSLLQKLMSAAGPILGVCLLIVALWTIPSGPSGPSGPNARTRTTAEAGRTERPS